MKLIYEIQIWNSYMELIYEFSYEYSYMKCGHRGRPRALPTPQAGARALAGPPFRARKTPCLFGLVFLKTFSGIGAWGPRQPLILLLAGPGPGRSPQARAQPAHQGLAPAQPGPGQNAKMAQGAGK